MSTVKVFKVFLWKNLLFLKFNWLSLTIAFVGCLTLLNIYLKYTYQLLTINSIVYESKDTSILKAYFPANDGDYVLYAPSQHFTDDIMKTVRLNLQINVESLKAYKNASEMLFALENDCKRNCFAIEFLNYPQRNMEDKNFTFKYTLRSTALRVSPKKLYINDEEIHGIKDDDDYIRTGFLTLQNMINTVYTKMMSKNTNGSININENMFGLEISSMPSISLESMGSERITSFGLIYIILLDVLIVSTFLVPLVEEKQDGFKEFLILATPLNSLNGATFFLIRLLLYLAFSTATLVIAFIYEALGSVPIIYTGILFFLYIFSLLSYTYLISVCFNTVFYAKVGGIILLVIPCILHYINGKLIIGTSIFFSTKCFMDGLKIFQIFTNKYRNFELSDLLVNITDDSFNILSIYTFLLCQSFLYILLYNYLSCVFPGPGGLKRSYLFFLKKSYYIKKHQNHYTMANGEIFSDVAIMIEDLMKKFHTSQRDIIVANRLNMQIKNREITVLLGHNGAGKTTILNMIIGIVPKDSGKITVCSERNVFSYRHLVGYCPQRSIYMHYMTCKQHLNFFAQLRGMSEQEAHKISEIHLKQLQLLDKQDEYGKNLSGGMKRRLSLGIAMTGETKIIVLDEPSSGLDIESRRNLWDILLDLRKTTAILVTTHHMEEAEILGDKICILGNGCLEHTGSPLELKRKFGNGYVLKLRVDKQRFNETETLNLLRPALESVTIINSNPPTVLMRLPYETRHKYNLALQLLEKKRKFLGIQYISISDASLEDVFLNCEAQGDNVDSNIPMHDEKDSVPYRHLYEKSISVSQQLMAVFYMKFIYLYNNWMYTLLMLFLPFVSIAFALLVMNSISAVDNENALNLNLRHIKKGVIVVSNRIDEINDRSELLKTLLVKDIENSGSTVRNINLPPTNSLSREIIRMQENDLSYFLQNIIGAIELTATRSGTIKVNIYFSGNIYHSSVILMNLVDNAILKLSTNKSQNIESVYIPIKRVLKDLSPSRLEYYAVVVPIGLFFYMFFYVSLPFKENHTQFKNLQPSPCVIYWFAVIAFDFLQHLIVCLLLCIFQAAIMPTGFYSNTEQYTIMMSILFYGFSYIPILYFLATACLSISTLTTYLLLMLVTSAILPLITSGSVQAMADHEFAILFFSLLPDFNLNHQLRQINENFLIYRRNLVLNNKTEDFTTYNKTQHLNVGVYFLYATIVPFVVMTVFIYFWENKERHQRIGNFFNCNKCRHSTKLNAQVCTTTTADDKTFVANEKALVKDVIFKGNQTDYALLVYELKKFFGYKIAVRELSFGVRRRECFGLLGVNGAGKTTTFEMLTANQTISGGSASIAGVNIMTNENQYKHLFGYCPQNDALHHFMTSYQILKYIALMRGIARSQVNREVEYWLMSLHLWRYKNVKIQNYSGGTKRKLNVAIAMIGSPEIIFLDEPTTGIDPVSRRFLWNCVREFQQRDKTVVLTSHSMDECEQLCTRLALMSDGDLKCIGCIPDLKQHYGTGFSVVIKTTFASNENINAITSQLRNYFSNVTFRECHAGFLTFFMEDSGEIMWSNVFNKMELLMSDCGYLIKDYSVNEAKLEDIILNLRQ